MTARLTSQMLVSALIRRADSAGGHALVVARGDESAGAIVVICLDRGKPTSLIEPLLGPGGVYGWQRVGPGDSQDATAAAAYLERRRARDRDLWLVELDIANAERFTAETLGTG